MMRISTNWLNDYVDISEENLHELADKITNAGVNVATVDEYDMEGLVVGEILEVNDHPNADKLHVCKVDIGAEENLTIVCGASNVRENLKVIVAKVGTVLPMGEIKKSKIRDVESEGMMCALMELGLEEENEENYKKGICELPNEAIPGSNPFIYIGLDDTIFNLDLNPNREADCTNHIGFAYEAAAVLGKKVSMPETKYHPIKEKVEDSLELDVITDNCTMYNARKVIDVTIKESPGFIKERLNNVGMRPINNVVDISNYIMLEYGQPLHFFDADKLGNSILVRMAEKGEKITTLDGQERKLTEEDIVITDGEKPVCIAGVMGGENSGIDENTKNVVIESAIFDPLKIRYTSIRLGLRSEASVRYEHGLNYEYTKEAIDRACYLLEKYADAKVLDGTVVHDTVDKTPKVTSVDLETINKILGLNMEVGDVRKAFDNLGFEYNNKGEEFTVTIPNRRGDVAIMEDLVEEVGRLYGFEHIVSKMPTLTMRRGVRRGLVEYKRDLSKKLRSLGLNETRTYTLVSPAMNEMFNNDDNEPIKVLKPLSNDKSIARKTLLPSLLNVANYNMARNIYDINIFEISNTYYNETEEDLKLGILISGNFMQNKWQHINVKSDFYVLKGIITNIFDYLGLNNRYTIEKTDDKKDMHEGATANIIVDGEYIGYMGRVHPNVSKEDIYVLEISLTKLYEKKTSSYKYKEISKYPSIVKDVAFVAPFDMESSTIEKEIRRNSGKLLKSIEVFDLYNNKLLGNDEKSIAYTLTYENNVRTLTQEEVNDAFNKMIDEVTKKLKIDIRK